MTLDGTAIPSLESGSSRVVHSALVYLHVGHFPISTSLSVARFLSGIFTVPKDIRSSEGDNYNDVEDELTEQSEAINYDLCKEVESLLPELLAIREEERIWAQKNQSL
jgi:hypothetical protein